MSGAIGIPVPDVAVVGNPGVEGFEVIDGAEVPPAAGLKVGSREVVPRQKRRLAPVRLAVGGATRVALATDGTLLSMVFAPVGSAVLAISFDSWAVSKSG